MLADLAATPSEHSAGVSVLLDAMGQYLHLVSADHIVFALAISVTAELDGDPCWGLLVGPASSGKTEAIRCLDDVADTRINEITAAGLLGWVGSATKGRPTGLLSRVGPRAFATIADLSALLAMSDRGARDSVYALLRRAYDGEVVRELGSAPHPLRWEGRLTLLAAVTPAIDRYSSHADALGPRWLYLRLPESTTADRRRASAAARRNGPHLAEHRARVQAIAAEVVRDAIPRGRSASLSSALEDAIDDAVMVACWARTAVERESYGARNILNLPVPEDSPRLAGQLAQLARALQGLGLSEDQTVALVRRSALDSMPQERRRVLGLLADGAPLTASEIARRAKLDRKVARFALEDLAAVGLTACEGDDDQKGGTGKPWRLVGSEGALVARVVAADDVGTRRRFPTPNPPEESEGPPTVRPNEDGRS